MTTKPNKSTGRGVQSVEVGARVLTALMRSGSPMMLRDVAEAADLIPAQAHAYLVSFRRVDLVEQEAGTGKYLLGPAALRLGMARIRGSQVMSAAQNEVSLLAAETGLLTAAVVLGPYGPTALLVQEGSEMLNINIRAGTTFSLTRSATGRIFAAFGGRAVEAQVEAELAAAPNARALREELSVEAARVRDAGYSSLVQSPLPGLTSISAPVTSASGELLLALTAVGTVGGLDTSPSGPAVARLLKVTRSLSASPDAGSAA